MATINKYTVKSRSGFAWRAQIRRKGYPPETKCFDSRADAKKWATVIESQMDQLKYIPIGDAENTTFKDALERYLIEVTPSKKGSQPEAARIKQLQSMKISDFSLTSLRSSNIAKLRDALQKEKKAPTTIKNLMTIISQVFETARQEWGMEALSNPVRGVRMPKNRLGRDRRLIANENDEKDEEKRLLDKCKISSCIYLEPIVIVALETGMRLGEIIEIQHKNINFSDSVVKLPDTKNGTSRDVPLSSRALAAINSAPRPIDGGQLFSIDVEQLKYHFRTARNRAEMNDFRFHDLRHEATSRLFEKGLDIMEVSAITGHKTLDMLKRYTHLRAADLAKKLG